METDVTSDIIDIDSRSRNLDDQPFEIPEMGHMRKGMSKNCIWYRLSIACFGIRFDVAIRPVDINWRAEP